MNVRRRAADDPPRGHPPLSLRRGGAPHPLVPAVRPGARSRGWCTMPLRPRKPCTTPGCPNRSDTGRCPTCRGRQRRTTNRRREGWAELYGTDWPAIRLDYLTRNPYCALCPRAASVADHHPKSLRQLRRFGASNPHADKYLRPLCKRCHDTETAKHQPGGWNRDRTSR